MDSIQFLCPSCQARCAIPATACGKTIRCPMCKAEFRAPEPMAAEPKGKAETNPSEGVQAKPSTPAKDRRSSENQTRSKSPRPGQGKAANPSVWPIILAAGAALVVLMCLVFVGGVARVLVQADADEEFAIHPPMFEEEKDGVLIEPMEKRDPPDWPKQDPPKQDPPKKEPPKQDPLANILDRNEPFELTRCPIDNDEEERMLPGIVNDIVVGGGGRFIIMAIPMNRTIAIFDVNEAKVVKYLPMGEDDVYLAAGMEKLFVCLPNSNVVECWSLRTFERVPNPLDTTVKAACMGWSSDGPLLLVGTNESLFINPRTMKPMDLRTENGPFSRNPGFYANIRAAGDGSIFTFMYLDQMLSITRIRDGMVTVRSCDTVSYHAHPGNDDSYICTDSGIFSNEARRISSSPKKENNLYPFVAAKQLRMYIRFGEPAQDFDAAYKINVFLHPGGDRLVSLPNFVGYDRDLAIRNQGHGRLTPDRRCILLPLSEVFIALPASNDRLVLRRLNKRLSSVKITSTPSKQATRGEIYRYDMTVDAKDKTVRRLLVTGPVGMKMIAQGNLTWHVPADFSARHADVMLLTYSGAGRILQPFRISIKDKAG